MQQVLSLPNLLSCLSEKDRYKGTQAYLNEILNYNEQSYALIDQALKQALLQTKTTPMAKLLSLRFLKEILMTANFSLIDAIDEKIEDHLVHVAQYNKKSKEVNRGANYLAEVFKIKNDAQTQKISSSYVLLALEIILTFGKWYTKDEDGEETRFYQYYHELSAAGVVFPTQNQLNFFKKDDEDKFKKNYIKWLQNFIQNGNLNQNSLNQAASKSKQQKNVKFTSQEQFIEKSKVQVKKQSEKQEKINANPSIIIDKTKQIAQLAQLKKELSVKDGLIKQLQSSMKRQEEKSLSLEAKIKSQQTQLLKLKQDLKNLKQVKQKIPQVEQKLECFQIVISPPKNTDDLIEQIDMLQDIMQSSVEGFQKEKNLISSQLNQLKTQNQQLKKTIQRNSKQLQNQRQEFEKEKMLMMQQKMIEQRVFRHSQAQSLRVTDQPKIGTRQMQEKELIVLKEEILTSRKEVLKDYSNTNRKLREQLSDVCQNKLEDISSNMYRQGSRSLKKTQSQHRLKMNQTSMTVANFKKTINQTENKLMKTAQSFKLREEPSKMVTIFPFLQGYFPQLPIQCNRFKEHCLFQLSEPFFENQLLKVALSKPTDSQNYFIYVYNKTGYEQKVKIIPNNASLSVEGEKMKKIPSLTAGQFQLKLGVPDLNMRYLTISIMIGNHGISLTSSTNEKIFSIPFPITLLDFFKIKKSTKRLGSISNGSKTIKYGANRFAMASNLPSLQQIFPSLTPESRFGETYRVGQIQCGKSSIQLQVSEWSRQLSIITQFSDRCQLSAPLSKVFLQVLMWLLRD